MATDLTPATEQSSHELAELLLRCRPAVKAYLTKAEQAVLVVGTTYQEHYRPALEADANRMRDLLDKIDNLIPGPHSPPVVYDPKLGHLIDSKTGVRVEPRIPSATEQTTDQWWRDASRERPARDRLVIAWTKEYGALLANRDTTNPDFGWSCCGKVTHWMPLPEVPNVK